jgi:hypothetical protein
MAAGRGPGNRPVHSHLAGVQWHPTDNVTYYSTPYSPVFLFATVYIQFDIFGPTSLQETGFVGWNQVLLAAL